MRYRPFENIKSQLKQFIKEGCVDSQIDIEEGERTNNGNI